MILVDPLHLMIIYDSVVCSFLLLLTSMHLKAPAYTDHTFICAQAEEK